MENTKTGNTKNNGVNNENSVREVDKSTRNKKIRN
jgi:hypothetical protein